MALAIIKVLLRKSFLIKFFISTFVTKGRGREAKDTWWWNEEVQRAIKEKKECYRRLYHDRSGQHREVQGGKEDCKASCKCGKG